MVQIKKVKLRKNVFLLLFKTPREASSTMLRFEEYYESPRFGGKAFSFGEFRKWYTKKRGKFTYYDDFTAFNLPSSVLKPFIDGKFNPLSEPEQQIIDMFKGEKWKFYIIAVYNGIDKGTLKHELAHALFYVDLTYKKQVLSLLKKFNIQELKDEIYSANAYRKELLDDEAHACIVGTLHEMKSKVPPELKEALISTFNMFSKWNIDVMRFSDAK